MFLGLTIAEWIMLGVVLFVIIAQLATKITTDVVYLIAMLIMLMTGLMDSAETFAGLVTPATLFLLFMFVIVECMERTNALNWIMNKILGRHRNMTSTLLRLTATATAMSAFICNPSVGQIMYHSVAEWGRKYKIAPSKLLLPVAYLIAIGGTCTVIAYPVNLLLVALLEHDTGKHYSIFFTLPGGLFCAVVCIVAILLLQRRLPTCNDPKKALTTTDEYLVEMKVPSNNKYVGKTVHEAGLDTIGCGRIVRIVHYDKAVFAPVAPEDIILGDDRIVFTGDIDELIHLRDEKGFVSSADYEYSNEQKKSKHKQFYAVTVTQKSPFLGKCIADTQYERKAGVVLFALLRSGERIDKLPRETKLKVGDTLILEGDNLNLAKQSEQYVLHNVSEPNHIGWRGSASILSVIIMITLSAMGIIPLVNATFCTMLLLCIIGCCTRAEAWNSINWNLIVMMTGAFAMGVAMQNSGLAATISQVINSLCGNSPLQTTIILAISAIIMTQVLFDATVVPILAPIALESAVTLNVSPIPFVMAVLLGSACNFTTQISTAHMIMVYPIGGYRLKDLIRFGLPFCIIMAIAIVVAVTLFYPY